MPLNSDLWSWANVIHNCFVTAGEDKQSKIKRCSTELLRLTRKARLEQDIADNRISYYDGIQPRTLRDLCRGKNIELGSLLKTLAKNECVLHLYHPLIGWKCVQKPSDFGKSVWSMLHESGHSIASYAKYSAFSRQTLSSIVNGTNDSLAHVMIYTVLTISYELDIELDVKYTAARKQRELEFLEKM